MGHHMLDGARGHDSVQDIQFGLVGNAQPFLTDGWSTDEDGFIWMIGGESGMRIETLPAGSDLWLRITLFPHILPPLLVTQPFTIYANGHQIYSGSLDREEEIACRISADVAGRGVPLELRVVHPHGTPPSALAPSQDGRALAIAIRHMIFSTEPPPRRWRAPTLEALGLPEQIDFAFLDDAVVAEGVPANFKGNADYIQASLLMKAAQFSAIGRYFGERRLSGLGDDAAYFPVGLWASPHSWLGRDGAPILAEVMPDLGGIFARHAGLKLLLDYSSEAGLGAEFLPALDEVISLLSVDPSRIVVLVSNRGVAARHRARANTGAHLAYQIVGCDLRLAFSAVEFARHRWYGRPDVLISPTEIAAKRGTLRSHKILSLNRRPRWHRLMLAMMLGQIKLRGDTIASMPSLAFAGDWHPETVDLDNHLATLPQAMQAALQKVRDASFASLPWVIDVNLDNTGRNAEFAYDQHPREPYLQSYLSVVTESYFEGAPGDVFITEKTCKAIAGMQPFLLFGQSGTLAALRGHGFETPTPFGAGYDEEPDAAARLVALHKGLSEIAAVSIGDLHSIYYDMLPVLRHNFERLFDIPEIIGRQLHIALLTQLETAPYRCRQANPSAFHPATRPRCPSPSGGPSNPSSTLNTAE